MGIRAERRPLSPVFARSFEQRLQEAERLDWLGEACARLGEEATKSAAASNDDGWRIKGSKGFEPRELACLKALWDWREREAIQANRS